MLFDFFMILFVHLLGDKSVKKTFSYRVPTRYWKYWILKSVFKTLKKYWNWPKYALSIEKVWKFWMEKKFEVPEQNFTEGKAVHYLCSVMQCAKLSFMIKNLEKWREVMVLNFFNLVLKRYWKSMENDF